MSKPAPGAETLRDAILEALATGPMTKAELARHLAAIEAHLGPLMWSTVTDLLLWGKSAETWAFECRSRGYRLDRRAAKAALTCAIDAIASMKSPRPTTIRSKWLEAR